MSAVGRFSTIQNLGKSPEPDSGVDGHRQEGLDRILLHLDRPGLRQDALHLRRPLELHAGKTLDRIKTDIITGLRLKSPLRPFLAIVMRNHRDAIKFKALNEVKNLTFLKQNALLLPSLMTSGVHQVLRHLRHRHRQGAAIAAATARPKKEPPLCEVSLDEVVKGLERSGHLASLVSACRKDLEAQASRSV